MNLNWSLWKILTLARFPVVLTACERKPFEKAGKAVDRAGEKINEILK